MNPKTQQLLVLLFSHSVVVAILTSQVQWSQATLQNKQLWAVLIRHSVIVKLITSHYKVKFIAVNFSYACLWSRNCAPSRPYPRTRLSESFTRPGCTNSNTHSINLGKTKSKPNEAFTTKQSQDSEIFQGATPLSRTRNGVGKLRDGLKVCVNGCERLGTPNGACRHRVITPLT